MPTTPQFLKERPRIYKYSFGHIDRGILSAKIEGPAFIDLLDIQEQGDTLECWAIVDISKTNDQKIIQVYSAYTGDPPPGNEWVYYKTIQSDFDNLVYHIYIKMDW